MVTLSGRESDESVHGGYLPGGYSGITLSLGVTVRFLLQRVKSFARNKRISAEASSLPNDRPEAECSA
jgi:hypothetical protein